MQASVSKSELNDSGTSVFEDVNVEERKREVSDVEVEAEKERGVRRAGYVYPLFLIFVELKQNFE